MLHCLAGSPKRKLFQPIESWAKTASRTPGVSNKGGGQQIWTAEAFQSLEDCLLQEWMGVFFCQISFKGSEIGLPGFISSFCSAHKHVLCCFRLVTAGTTVVGLLFPELESGIHTTVFRSVFGDPPAVTELEGSHEISACIPVHIGDGLGWDSAGVVVVVLGPIVDGVVVFQNGINDVGMGTAELCVLRAKWKSPHPQCGSWEGPLNGRIPGGDSKRPWRSGPFHH